MVWAPAGPVQPEDLPAASVGECWLDRFEVTNREYQAFVDQGGYATREHWAIPFVEDGRELS